MFNLGNGASDPGFASTPYSAADLPDASYGGHAVYWTGSAWALASDTSQVATQMLGATSFRGVLVEGGEAGRKLTVAYCCTGGVIPAKAGTGGVSAGDYVVPEYAASGTDRGRFITASVAWQGMPVFGRVLTTASEDDEFLLDMNASKVFDCAWAAAPTAIATEGAHTITADELFSVRIARDPAGDARTDTTDTAANIIAAMTARGLTAAGECIEVNYANVADGAEAITLAAGASVTATNTGADLVISQNESARLVFTKITATTVSLLVIKD